MTDLQNKTVAQLVSENIRTADVFKKYGIDFCCGGSKSITEVCREKEIDIEEFAGELSKTEKPKSYDEEYVLWDADVLIDHIIEKHHAYVQEAIPLLIGYADKVAEVHGEHAPETIEIKTLMHAIAEELMLHMHKEEAILFPYIRQLVNAKRNAEPAPVPMFGTVRNPINMMEREHESAGDAFKKMRSLSNDFTPPEWACNTYKALYAKLEEFETDLHVHIHLENNILHHRAVELEAELNGSQVF